MKESHTEGPASHGDPASCAGVRKGAGEALTGAHTGGASSRENRCNQGADAVDPFAYLRDVLERISTHPASRIAELLPRNWKPSRP